MHLFAHLQKLTPEVMCRAVSASASQTDAARCERNVCKEDDHIAHVRPVDNHAGPSVQAKARS